MCVCVCVCVCARAGMCLLACMRHFSVLQQVGSEKRVINLIDKDIDKEIFLLHHLALINPIFCSLHM